MSTISDRTSSYTRKASFSIYRVGVRCTSHAYATSLLSTLCLTAPFYPASRASRTLYFLICSSNFTAHSVNSSAPPAHDLSRVLATPTASFTHTSIPASIPAQSRS